MMTLTDFLGRAWQDYARITPDAPLIHELLRERGERIVNDHVAFRTFNLEGMSRFEIGRVFEEWGYLKSEDLHFPEKQLMATYYLHPDENFPKIFISELLVEKFSDDLQTWIRGLAAETETRLHPLGVESLLEPNWGPVRFEDYQRFYQESEYAAWTAAFGIRVNHFTVLVNSLKTFESLQELNEFLLDRGFTLNPAGGLIKGAPSDLLEQSSTMAKHIPWNFSGGIRRSIMGCYYEFARRYDIPGTQHLFPGFVPKSADKIFESTFEARA